MSCPLPVTYVLSPHPPARAWCAAVGKRRPGPHRFTALVLLFWAGCVDEEAMRKLLSFIFMGLAAAVGCGGVSAPPEPRMIPGGGVADGKVSGNLFVYVIDEETRAAVS